MMEKCGVSSLRELYSDVPSDCIYEGEYNLPKAMSELEVRRHFASLASQNLQARGPTTIIPLQWCLTS